MNNPSLRFSPPPSPERDQGTLSDLLRSSTSSAYEFTARESNNLGNFTLVTSMPMADFFRMSIVANEEGEERAQRRLDKGHATKLAKFQLKGLVSAAKKAQDHPSEAYDRILHRMGEQAYTAMQPIVVNIRTAGRGGASLSAKPLSVDGVVVAFRISLKQRDLLYVVDGQHRRMGIEEALRFLEEIRLSRQYPKQRQSLYPYEGTDRTVPTDELLVWEQVYAVARSMCTVAIEAHLGLDIQEERQLFHDLNNLTKSVEKSLALEFDTSNPVNNFIKNELVGRYVDLAETEKVDWDDPHTGVMSLKDLVAVNSILILNKTNIRGATQMEVDAHRDVAEGFWDAVSKCNGFGEEDARHQTVLAQPVMLKALAKLTFDFAFGRQRSEEYLRTLLEGIPTMDFSHENPVWRYYEMNEAERKRNGLAKLSEYLPSDVTGNRDIGAYDKANDVMRFGAKHNDIYPILGDMVRFQLGLPSRQRSEAMVD